jgi:hypothetical protein
MKELFVAEAPRQEPTLTASDPPAKKKVDDMSHPAYIIVPTVLGGLFFFYAVYSLFKYFTENRRY